jgi:hypothetical protein
MKSLFLIFLLPPMLFTSKSLPIWEDWPFHDSTIDLSLLSTWGGGQAINFLLSIKKCLFTFSPFPIQPPISACRVDQIWSNSLRLFLIEFWLCWASRWSLIDPIPFFLLFYGKSQHRIDLAIFPWVILGISLSSLVKEKRKFKIQPFIIN